MPDVLQLQRLREVWDRIPDAGCKGLCAEACGPIGVSRLEAELLEARTVTPWPTMEGMIGEYLADPDHYHCPLLVDGRCSAYKVRPTICRLFGAEETMVCPHGCVPEGGHLPHAEGSAIIQASLDAGGEAWLAPAEEVSP